MPARGGQTLGLKGALETAESAADYPKNDRALQTLTQETKEPQVAVSPHST
jgi:hypothetical protein